MLKCCDVLIFIFTRMVAESKCRLATNMIFTTVVVSMMVVSILLAIFWRQQIGWSYCAGSRRFGLVA